MENELEQEKVNLFKISNENQRLEEHFRLSNDKTSIIRRNSEPKKDDNLKKERIILEALSTKVMLKWFKNYNFYQFNFFFLKARKFWINIKFDSRNQELEAILTQKTVVIDLFLTKIQNKMPFTMYEI